MTRSIVVAGVGQLGSRYIQGLAHYYEPLNIYAFDISEKSLANAQLRWKEIKPLPDHCLSVISDVSKLPKEVDLVIVASTASIRLSLVASLVHALSSQYWLLEKVLATSVDDIYKIQHLLQGSMAWVNTPRMYFPLFQQFSRHLSNNVCHIEYPNMAGIACNAIHLIDYFSRSINTEVEFIDVRALQEWEPSTKREMVYEVSGDLIVLYKNGSTLKIHGTPNGNSLKKSFTVSIHKPTEEIWCVVPANNLAFSSRGDSLEATSTLYQSEFTATLVYDIFNTKSPLLPTLDQSISQHLPFIDALVSHWCDKMSTSSSIPIT